MLEAQWSRSDFKSQFPNCHSLKELISEIENIYWSKGEVVCGIKVNGMVFSESDEVNYSSSNISEIESIVVQVENTDELILKTKLDMKKWLVRAEVQSVEIAEKFQGKKIGTAHDDFVHLVSGCQWLTETWGLVKGLSGKSPEAENLEKRLVQVIGELLKAFELKDYHLAADILEYELSSCLQDWTKIL